MKRTILLLPFALGGLAVSLAGCTVLSPKSDPTRLYVLRSRNPTNPPPATAPFDRVVQVGPGRLADYLVTTSIVVWNGPQEVKRLGVHEWAEPLGKGINWAMAENLSRRLPGARVISYPEPLGTEGGLQIRYQVLRFEGELTGNVVLEVSWLLVGPPSGSQLMDFEIQ